MLSTANPTALKLLDACEHVLCEVEALEDVTVRRVAGEANANPSAISYHFGSQKPPPVRYQQRRHCSGSQRRPTEGDKLADEGAPHGRRSLP
jgi:hypothetical protein